MSDATRIQIDFERHTLDNGLQVVLHRDATLPLVAVNLWYHVGSKNEKPGRTGLAHLFEHMLFQGSEHVGSSGHFQLVQQVGGVANGSTWYDRTSYYETLPAHQLDLGLWLESDRMGFLLPALTQEKLDTQRAVVMNERRQRVDNQAYGRGFERLKELLFPPEFPYHWPVIGYMEDIAAASLGDVQDFFRTYYTPNNAVLTLAGDFDPGFALTRVERYFGSVPRGQEVQQPWPRLEELGGERRETLEDRVQLPRILLAYRVPSFGEKDWYAADLLSRVWASGKSSVLYHDLVYRLEIAQEVMAWVNATELAGTLIVVATARPGVAIAELETALLERLDRSRSEVVAEDVLEQARNRMLTGYFADLERLDQRADLLSQFATFFDDPGRVCLEAERYAEITPEELRDCAARCIRPEDRVVVTVLPERGG